MLCSGLTQRQSQAESLDPAKTPSRTASCSRAWRAAPATDTFYGWSSCGCGFRSRSGMAEGRRSRLGVKRGLGIRAALISEIILQGGEIAKRRDPHADCLLSVIHH